MNYIIILIMIIIILFIYNKESFASKPEKAEAIYDWFVKNDTPKYTKYRRDLENQSNIVEYEDALTLFKNNNLSLQNIEKII